MDLIMIVYAILTAILSIIIVEEVRDLRYFPLLASLGLALVGIALAGGAQTLISPEFTQVLMIALATASTIVALAFFYDLRRITSIERDAIILEKKVEQFHTLNTALCSAAINLQNKVAEQTATLALASEETARSVEAIHVA